MGTSVIITIISTSGVAIISHFLAIGKLKDRIHNNEIEIERLKTKDALQQQILDQLDNLVLKNLPDFFEALKMSKNGR